MQGLQSNAPTTEISNTPLRDATPDIQVEYLSQAFQQVILDNQSKHTTTAPTSPFQNGKSERSWQSLMEMAHSLRIDANVSKSYWPYAVRNLYVIVAIRGEPTVQPTNFSQVKNRT